MLDTNTPLSSTTNHSSFNQSPSQSFNGDGLRTRRVDSAHRESSRGVATDSELQPIWDRNRRELRLGDDVVKLLRWPAKNQEHVLDAFEELGWPERIDDPIPKHSEIPAKQRLHDTIKCLNRNQYQELIKFRGDGTGAGVLLEINGVVRAPQE